MTDIHVMKHPACAYAKEDGENGYHIGMDAQAIPKKRKHQAYGTGEMNIQPFLRVLRLK